METRVRTAQEIKRDNLRATVRGAYDVQKLRIQMGNRIVGNFKVKLGQRPGKKESDELDSDAKDLLAQLREAHARITDGVGVMPTPKKFKAHGIIETYTEALLTHTYFGFVDQEHALFERLEGALLEHPVYVSFLSGVPGVGPAMAGVICSEIDISKARYVSSLWKYAGLDVAEDGRGRSKKKEHLIEVAYKNKEGEMADRLSITFNPWLKTKLVGVLASSFLKIGAERCPYAGEYYGYKTRIENDPRHAEKSLGHRHNMAMRYMVKQFLRDLYLAWREIEGLEIAADYHEAKLGHAHVGNDRIELFTSRALVSSLKATAKTLRKRSAKAAATAQP